MTQGKRVPEKLDREALRVFIESGSSNGIESNRKLWLGALGEVERRYNAHEKLVEALKATIKCGHLDIDTADAVNEALREAGEK